MRIMRVIAVWSCVCVALFGWGENLKSIEADFEQHIENDDGPSVYYKGKVMGKSPNKVKWDYQMPLQKEIYMNGNEVMIYEPHLEQVSLSRLNVKNDFISIIKSAKKRDDGTYSTFIDDIEYVIFIDKDDKPERITFTDSMGAKSTLILHNVKLNPAINDRIFDFSPPDDVEIVELRAR